MISKTIFEKEKDSMQLTNIPEVKLGLVAVSRDCFPVALSEKRRAAVKAACSGGLYECPVTVENEQGMLKAVEEESNIPLF